MSDQSHISTSSSHFSLTPPTEALGEKWEVMATLTPSSSGIYRLYKARRGGRIFALKALAPEHAGSVAYRQLLIKEYQLGLMLNHQGVARTFGLEQVAGVGECIVMEYVNGPTLREYLGNGALQRQEAEMLLRRMCEALSYIHACQVMHLDIKPSNIMLLKGSNIIKIIDFGFSDSPLFTKLKAVGSTRKYAAPELTEGEEDIDNRADIYSLGVIMQQMRPQSDRAWHSVAARCCKTERSGRPRNAYDIPLLLEKARKRRAAIYASVGCGVVLASGAIFTVLNRPADVAPKEDGAPLAKAIPTQTIAEQDSFIVSDTARFEPYVPSEPLAVDSMRVSRPIAEEEEKKEAAIDDSGDLIENQIYNRALQAARVRWNEHIHKMDTLKHRRTLDLCHVGYWRHLAKEDVSVWLKTKMPAESPAFNQMMQIAAQTIKQYGENPERKGEENEGLRKAYKRTGMVGWVSASRQRLPDGRVRLDSLLEDGTYYIEVGYTDEDLKRWNRR